MAHEFLLPDIGEGLTEAEIVEWRVAVGDEVAMDQVVVDVETDKAVVEIPTPVAGIVLHLGGTTGETVEVGQVLIVIGAAGEEWPPVDEAEETTPVPPTIDAPLSGDAPPIVGTLDTEATLLQPSVAGSSTGPAARALPVVRKLARGLGVDLDGIQGTGPEGRVTREDVLAAADRTGDARSGAPTEIPAVEPVGALGADETDDTPVEPEAESSPQPEPEATAAPDSEQDAGQDAGTAAVVAGRPLSRLRRTIAERMSRSWAEIPQVTTFDEVDATRLLEVKRALTARTGVVISLDALVAKAVAPVLVAYPDFNARLEGDLLVDNPTVDMGVAVDTPDGLVVVVVRDVVSRQLSQLAGEIARLAEAAKARTARPDEMSGQSFTVSNIGAVGGGYGTPIVPYGTVGILSVGRAVEKPVARHGQVTVAPMMPLSLSYDHRVVDGAAGRRFLAAIIENLAEPALFLAD
jgi:pyruvate dehydrogenase E2 component (dihydrolipoamide acetyltransferase)